MIVTFYVGPNLPLETTYQIEMFFKFKIGIGNCVQQNTKYIFDNFTICDLQEVAEKGTNHTATQSVSQNAANTGINTSLLVYPNPTMGTTQLNIPNGILLNQIYISDIYGSIVGRQNPGTTISVSGLGKGFYIVTMIKPREERISNKLVVN